MSSSSVARRWGHTTTTATAIQSTLARGPSATTRLDRKLLRKVSKSTATTSAVRLDLSSLGLEEADPAELAEYTSVRCVLAGDNHLPFETFAKMPRLQILELQLNQLSGLGPFNPALDFLLLTVLDLSYNTLDPAGVAALASLTRLESLELSHNDLRALPPDLSDGFFALQHLVLDDNALESPAVFQALAGLGRLASLSLARNRVTFVPNLIPYASEPALDASALPFPMLQVLSLVGNRLVAPADVEALASWPSLVQVLLWDTPLVTTRRELPSALRTLLLTNGVHVARKPPPPPPRNFRGPALPSLVTLVRVDTQLPDFSRLPGSPPGPPLRYIRGGPQFELQESSASEQAAAAVDDDVDFAPPIDDAVSYVSSSEPRPDSDARPSTNSRSAQLGSFFLTSMGPEDDEDDDVDVDVDGHAESAEPGSAATPSQAPAVQPVEQRLALPLIAQAKAHATAIFASVEDLRLENVEWGPREHAPVTAHDTVVALRHVLHRAKNGLDALPPGPAAKSLGSVPDRLALLKPRRPTTLPPLQALVDTLI